MVLPTGLEQLPSLPLPRAVLGRSSFSWLEGVSIELHLYLNEDASMQQRISHQMWTVYCKRKTSRSFLNELLLRCVFWGHLERCRTLRVRWQDEDLHKNYNKNQESHGKCNAFPCGEEGRPLNELENSIDKEACPNYDNLL